MAFKKDKVATKDIDKYCEPQGLEKISRNSRDKARDALADVQRTHWSIHQQAIMNAATATVEPVTSPQPLSHDECRTS